MSEAKFEGGHPGPEWLSAWHDGELQDEASAAMRSHLESCVACQKTLEELRQVDHAVRLGDQADPGAAWADIEGRLRARLEDELGLGVPTGAPTRYVETDADMVLRPVLAEVPTRGARPFRLRWALATAAGLAVALFTLRQVSDRTWTVGRVGNPEQESDMADNGAPPAAPAGVARQNEPMADQAGADRVATPTPPAVAGGSTSAEGTQQSRRRPEADEARVKELADHTPVADHTSETDHPAVAAAPREAPTLSAANTNAPPPAEEKAAAGTWSSESAPINPAAPRDYLAEVERTVRRSDVDNPQQTGLSRAESVTKVPAHDTAARMSEAADHRTAESGAARPPIDPEYAMVYAAASRAREAGRFELARRGFALVAAGIPDDELARDAEYEVALAGARLDIAGGEEAANVSRRLAERSAASWSAVAEGNPASCRRALADLRAAMTLADETDGASPAPDTEARLRRLRSCSR